MSEQPTPENDTPETEAHAARGRFRNASEAEAHAATSKHRGDTGADDLSDPAKAPGTVERNDSDDDGPETEAHKAYARSDARLKTRIRSLVG